MWLFMLNVVRSLKLKLFATQTHANTMPTKPFQQSVCIRLSVHSNDSLVMNALADALKQRESWSHSDGFQASQYTQYPRRIPNAHWQRLVALNLSICTTSHAKSVRYQTRWSLEIHTGEKIWRTLSEILRFLLRKIACDYFESILFPNSSNSKTNVSTMSVEVSLFCLLEIGRAWNRNGYRILRFLIGEKKFRFLMCLMAPRLRLVARHTAEVMGSKLN